MASQNLSLLEDMIVVPNVILALSVSLFTLVSNSFEDFMEPRLLATISGGCSLLTGTISGILKKWDLSRTINGHDNLSELFGKLSQEIRFQLALPYDDRERMPVYLQNTVVKYQEYMYSHPRLTRDVIAQFKRYNIKMGT